MSIARTCAPNALAIHIAMPPKPLITIIPMIDHGMGLSS